MFLQVSVPELAPQPSAEDAEFDAATKAAIAASLQDLHSHQQQQQQQQQRVGEGQSRTITGAGPVSVSRAAPVEETGGPFRGTQQVGVLPPSPVKAADWPAGGSGSVLDKKKRRKKGKQVQMHSLWLLSPRIIV